MGARERIFREVFSRLVLVGIRVVLVCCLMLSLSHHVFGGFISPNNDLLEVLLGDTILTRDSVDVISLRKCWLG